MSFTIKLGTVTDPDTKIVKSFSEVKSLTGVLKNETSILDPTILIDCNISEIVNCNYMTIDTFGRKYYITDIRSISNNLVEIKGHVDVLNTYSSQILNNSAILKNSQTLYNNYLDDGGLLKLCYDKQSVTNFPSGFDTYEYVLAVAGS